MQLGLAAADLQAQRALPGRRNHLVDRKARANAVAQAQAHQAGRGQHDRVVAAFVELAQAGVEVAAQRRHAQVGTQRQQLRHPAQAGGAHQRALRQFGDRRPLRRNEGIARILAIQHRHQLEAGGQLHRHVLERVHGQVRGARFQRGLELLDEQPLAADLGQRAVDDLVAARGHSQQRSGQPQATPQQRLHMLRLPEREAAFAGGDHDVVHLRIIGEPGARRQRAKAFPPREAPATFADW